MSLDTAIQLFQSVDTFEEYKEGLLAVLMRCHSQEELDRARRVIDEKKQYMMENSPEFRGIIGTREQTHKLKAEYEKAIHRAKLSEAKADAARTHAEALAKVPKFRDKEVEDWVSNTRYKTYDPDEKEKQIEAGLWCPICQKEDKRGNIVNGKPTCTKCWHKLVPKDNLKDYPRKYRRAWKR